MAEWSKAVDSKSIVRLRVPGVRIPLSPPHILPCESNQIAKEKNISINEDCPINLRARINPALMIQALSNLIENAVKYSEPDTIVNVRVEKVEQELKISVNDQGHGISP